MSTPIIAYRAGSPDTPARLSGFSRGARDASLKILRAARLRFGQPQYHLLGYLIKDSPREEILYAIREVSQGHSYLSAVVAGKLASVLRQKRAANVSSVLEPLTQREENILALVRSGSSNTAISRALNISETTVRTHIYHILQKMGLKNRSELLMYLLQQREGLK